MRRRAFVYGSVAMVATPLAEEGQQAGRTIGYLSTRSPTEAKYVTDAFIRGLRDMGYVEGRNLNVEFRWADLQYDRLPALASDLVRRGVGVIAAVGGAHSGLAAKAATSTIPIVFVSAGDPITFGLVTSLSRPGGNVTGVSMITVALAPKRFELLHQIVPPPLVIAMLVNPSSPYVEPETKDVIGAARALERRIHVLKAATSPEIDRAFATLGQQGAGAVLISGDPFFDRQRDKLVALAVRYRIPAIYQWDEFATIGGLMSYGTSITNAYREAGVYSARILKGAKPAELPVLQPTKVELVVNLKTAKALGTDDPAVTAGARRPGDRVRRRAFLYGAALMLATRFIAEAQPAGKVPRVGILLLSDSAQSVAEAFRQGLRELGYVEGQTIAIEYRWAEGKEERFSDLASELVHLKVDVIFATVAAAVRAAQQATKTIPIVTAVNDPVAAGFVASVARPGGNITGLSMMSPEVVGKQLELLRQMVPKISRVAVLANPANPGSAPQVRQAEVVARALGMQLQPLQARSPSEIDSAFSAMTRERAGALLVLLDPTLARAGQRERIAELAARGRLPAMYALRLHVEAGGLMAYGADIFDLYRRTATYVDRILKGAKPADLPIEQPTKFELVINLKTAKALGLTIPPSLLARVDQVIE